MEYMIRFTQVHETFRLAEIEALAVLEGINLEVLSYSPSVSASSLTLYFFTHISQSHHFALSNSSPKKQLKGSSVEAFSPKQSMKSGETDRHTKIFLTMSVTSPNTYGICTKIVLSSSPSTLFKAPGPPRSSEN